MIPVTYLKARQTPCPRCGKQCYRSRRGARAAGHLLYPARRMYAYRCGGYWHLTSMIMRLGRVA
jgi:hypothetical protein